MIVIGIMASLVCQMNGQHLARQDREAVDLEAMPLNKLLEMKKALKPTDFPSSRTEEPVEQSTRLPNALALRRTDFLESTAGSSVQTAFQMSLTVLSFLAFGGYVISLIAQNMRKPTQLDGMTAPQTLNKVVVNQNRRPFRPSATTAVGFGRRKRSRRYT
ncbi:uncharacterized protein LOC126834854 [Adelges cooleyi]|uniref:uncharacterized protein LOC126834854 n=1 Tax=Adelges cooleyi TaxID=133065 RepID=UPI00217F8B3A|nr:uncharacterized protein LOC126834854 [Adelges cooleyi]XP_050423011.1 uncharacterized protein LOC126834854 [Adelges cooleyi]XP_050423012.1 uncharacterized protein LOC126834854 [Adelges cooleyi]